MNKAQEIHTLTAFIASLPHDSYLRPWLEQELAAIERAMQGDVPLDNYCHGFVELMDISKRLDERAEALAKKEREHAQRCRDLADDKQRFASFIERVSTDASRFAGLAAGWKADCPRA